MSISVHELPAKIPVARAYPMGREIIGSRGTGRYLFCCRALSPRNGRLATGEGSGDSFDQREKENERDVGIGELESL
jgi:hypothetical protein